MCQDCLPDKPLTYIGPVSTEGCKDAEPCDNLLSDQCILYTGADVAALGIKSGDRLINVLKKLIAGIVPPPPVATLALKNPVGGPAAGLITATLVYDGQTTAIDLTNLDPDSSATVEFPADETQTMELTIRNNSDSAQTISVTSAIDATIYDTSKEVFSGDAVIFTGIPRNSTNIDIVVAS